MQYNNKPAWIFKLKQSTGFGRNNPIYNYKYM